MTRRSAVISFRTSVRGHDFVLLQNRRRIDAGNGLDHVARLTRLTPGDALPIHRPLGNHGVKAGDGKPELEAFHSLGKERWYRFTWGNAGVVVLDSDTSVAPGLPQLRFARSGRRASA